MSRLPRVLLVAAGVAISLGLVTPAAGAVPDRKLGATLGAVWETVLETPPAQNPFTGGDPCIRLGKVVAPFTPLGSAEVTCTVKPGTRVFVTAESSECSTVEPPPFFGADEASLRECAREADAGFATPSVTVDGRIVAVSEVETGLLALDIPADNILGVPAQQAFSVAHGWVALLPPMHPGSHLVVLRIVGTDVFGNHIDLTNRTTIVVKAAGR
jgi:hypothetical protein